jgi:hypothetical protein
LQVVHETTALPEEVDVHGDRFTGFDVVGWAVGGP